MHVNRIKKKIESGVIKVTAQKHPAFLYEGDIPEKDFDPENVTCGFLRGFLLERVGDQNSRNDVAMTIVFTDFEAYIHIPLFSIVCVKVP
jgi:hypothetical protein